jgi:hypothetical protein
VDLTEQAEAVQVQHPISVTERYGP